MISLEMDMVQYDCPYIDTTVDHDVSFLAKQWDFSTADRELETRIMVRGSDGDALDHGLSALREHQNMRSYELLRRKGEVALIRSRIDETAAMHAIRENDGYITGPFRIRDGSEIWHVGFDSEDVAEGELAELERYNDFSVSTGYVKTPLVTDQIPDTADQRGISVDDVIDDVMLGQSRVKEMMAPVDVANLFVFGFSEHGSHLNGGDLLFDGGMTLTYE